MNRSGAEAPFDSWLIWDAHAGFESWPHTDLTCLDEWRNAGVGYLSVNVGYDVQPWHNTVAVLAAYRRWLDASDDFVLAASVGEVRTAQAEGRMAVAFDIEGMAALNGSIDLLHLYYELGVRQIAIAYNRNNAAGGGCHDADPGLTAFGRRAVQEMQALGMFVDCSHTGHRTTMEVMALATRPVIFSHANPRALRDHQRNILDEQATACAATDGVVGVNGIGLFLGDDDIRTACMADHVEYYLDLIGPAHVGVGLDYFPTATSEHDEGFNAVLAENADYWPSAQYPGGEVRCAHPTQLQSLAGELLDRGYDEQTVKQVLGENFARVAQALWG